ncbi:MAG: hypothetical protein HYS07_03290 [Chlamydiae bacterium]|nr:hypothetical protein [Chlamydiota bacterium]MBI3276864.1 hypothetical protein [Chlamydiota bacterium]
MKKGTGETHGKNINKKIGFSPIYVDANLFTPKKVISLYHFVKTIFPEIGQSISASAIRNLSRGIRQWSSSITEEKRNELVQSLKGLSISIKVSIDQEGEGEMMAIPFYIKTDYIIENLIKAKPDVTRLDSELKEIKEVLLPVIKTAIKQRIKELVEGFFTLEVFRPEMRLEIKQLIDEGLITKEGRIANGVDLDQLLCDEYSTLFEKVDMEELKKIGLIKITPARDGE